MPEANSHILDLFMHYADQGLTFYQANQELLKRGYNQEAIQQVTDNYQYGSKLKQTDPTTVAYQKDPLDAAKVAQEILQDDKKERQEQAIADGLASQGSVYVQSRAKYQNNFLFDNGMSWWTWPVIKLAVSGLISGSSYHTFTTPSLCL